MLFVKHNGYASAHPYYYRTGGDVVSPRVISVMAYLRAKSEFENIASEENVFSGQVTDAVAAVSSAVQTKRISVALDHHHHELFKPHMPVYRKVAHNLRRFRKTGNDPSTPFDDLFSSMAFKHNHLFWHMRNLWVIDFLKKSEP